MRRSAGVAIAIALFVAGCKNKDQFTLDGKLENAESVKQVYLYKQGMVVDSAILSEDKEFKFKVAAPDDDFYFISAPGEKNYLFIAKNGDELDFSADYKNPANEYSIEGSEEVEKLEDFNKLSLKYQKIFADLQKQYEQRIAHNPAGRDAVTIEMTPVFEQNMNAFAQQSISFANNNKDNLAGVYAISSLDRSQYEQAVIDFVEQIRGKFPNNKSVEELVAYVDKVKTLSIGKTAPDFEASSINGGTIKLSNLRGKYVLVDFWASWCPPCREENPNLLKQYNAYSNKNFTVLGVSLDNDKAAWQKAVKDDKLTWNHVSELKQWDSEIARKYQVESLPSSFLLDPEGKIIAKNLRGQQLEDFLKKTLQ